MKNPFTPEIKGLLFDLDGTLIDSNDAHAMAWCDALSMEEIEADFEQIRRRIGMGGDHLLPSALGIDKESPLGARADKSRGEIFRSRYLPGLHAFPGSRELIEELKTRGYQLGLASSASKKDLRALLRQTGLDGLIENETTSSDAESSKPDPDVIEAALTKLGLRASEVLMIGDTPYDIEAASRAGVKTIGFTSGGWSPQSLGRAIAIFDGPEHLLKFLRGLKSHPAVPSP